MPIEQYTESIVLQEMKCNLGKNDFGFCFPQGDVEQIEKLENALKDAGGKPASCSLDDYLQGGNGKAKPEYIITFNNQPQTIIVIECKKLVSRHNSENLDHPKSYAVDGVLYYAKFLKKNYNVIAIGVSGTKKDKIKANAYHWGKNQDTYTELRKARDVIYEPENYLRLVSGEAVKKAISIEEIRNLAIEMNKSLREHAVTIRTRPVFIAGILIALKDKVFVNEYANLTTFKSLLNRLQDAINDELNRSDVRKNKIEDVKSHFNRIGRIEKLKNTPLGHNNSLLWYIEELEKKIKPMMDFADNTIDALGIFYHEFVKYTGGDGKGLGIVLTPQHLTEFMCDLAEINKKSKVVDICCGSGAFLVTAMSKMLKDANSNDITKIHQNSLFGVESDDEIYTLAIANMILRGDGKSNIIFGDCFKPDIQKELKTKKINIGLLNPPYSQRVPELEFVEVMLDILTVGGIGVVVVPMSCAIGTKFVEERERLFKKHTLLAVFSMPDDIFYVQNANSDVCVMVWEAHKTHDATKTTFFGYYKDDGFKKAKKLGRIDKFHKWNGIKNEWLRLYRERETKEWMSIKKAVDWNDEWLYEAYMETNNSVLTQENFQEVVSNYYAYLVKSTRIKIKRLPLDISKWKKFKIGSLFTIKNCKCSDASQLSDGDDIFYIGAKKTDNGIMKKTAFNEDLVTKGNCIVFICDGKGSVGYSNYMNTDFIGSTTLSVGYNDNLDQYTGLFIVTVLDLERPKYSYGRKYRKYLSETTIKLPKDKEGNPDWEYMRDYIKSLPYSNKI